jgi:hypothetical protein
MRSRGQFVKLLKLLAYTSFVRLLFFTYVGTKNWQWNMVARWYFFRQKIPIWVYRGGPWKENMLIYFRAIWNIVNIVYVDNVVIIRYIFFHVLVHTEKNQATLLWNCQSDYPVLGS